MTKQSMAELVAHLEAHGYAERVPGPEDGRARLVRATARGRDTRLVRATARGRDIYAIARGLVGEIDAELDAHLGPVKVRRLRALLVELDAGLDER
jgi:DNA-binding MarR family transcriptional regulator